jgi:hypothetical protein
MTGNPAVMPPGLVPRNALPVINTFRAGKPTFEEPIWAEEMDLQRGFRWLKV